MLGRKSTGRKFIGSLALVASLFSGMAAAWAHDASKYPDLRGQWIRVGSNGFDPDKPPGLAQEAPLTPEYQAILQMSLADQRQGLPGNNPTSLCTPPGMPRMMIGPLGGMEFVVSEDITYVLVPEPTVQHRRIYTDGRPWPRNILPSFTGYSIGTWEDEFGNGRFDVLKVETRGLRGPRSFDMSGIPFHDDNETLIKERITLDKANRNVLHDEITVFDHALTRPWVVTRSYLRDSVPEWIESNCADADNQVKLGNQFYFKSADGELMPIRKDQPPPDLKFFNRSSK
jgi:hypothetical protein